MATVKLFAKRPKGKKEKGCADLNSCLTMVNRGILDNGLIFYSNFCIFVKTYSHESEKNHI